MQTRPDTSLVEGAHEGFEFIPTTREEHDANAPMADFEPEELLRRTFLKIPEDNGERHRATIMEAPKETEDIIADKPEMVKFRCSVNNGQCEEILAYNEFCHYLEEDDDTDGQWKFHEILQHGNVRKGDPRAEKHGGYKGSSTNILVHWETRDKTWEPLQEMLQCDQVTCAVHAQKNGLLDQSGWKTCKRITKNEKKMLHMVHQAQLKSYHTAPKCKCGFEAPRNHKHAMRLDKQNRNTKWVVSEALELSQIDEHEAFIDEGPSGRAPPGNKQTRAHFACDIKHDGRHKSRLVADGHLTEAPLESI